MVFSSIVFLIYFLPFFILGYHITPSRFKNIFILISSILFYAWGAPQFIFVILGTTFLDFYLVKWMDSYAEESRRRLVLILSLTMNFGLLFYFKYCNFFVDNINILLEQFGMKQMYIAEIILPIGISFYTFESATYVIDVYRRNHKPLDNFWNYQTYIILFPKLIAGPIIRYHEISDQITDRSANDNIDYKITGIIQFVIGLSKKVLIANVLAVKADQIFALEVASLSSFNAWIGILAYTFQIYFDFSGYSDMAIGLGKIMGFKFPENFNNPYTSKSITEFWRRWHITLGKWMKNYLYIPLGGNKVDSAFRLYFNLWIVFLASGLWHGASWNFIIWGAYHGFFLVAERAFLLKVYGKLGRVIPLIFSFTAIVIGWVFFRATTVKQAMGFLGKLFSFEFSKTDTSSISNHFITVLIIAVFFSFCALVKPGKYLQQLIYADTITFNKTAILIPLAILLLTLSIASITGFGFNPFIYFRF